LSKRFPDYFGVGLLAAGALALAFGAMHLFARAMDYVEMLLGNSADIGEIVAVNAALAKQPANLTVGSFLTARFHDHIFVGLMAARALALVCGAMILFARSLDYIEKLLGDSAD
jgi:hypothetical protein